MSHRVSFSFGFAFSCFGETEQGCGRLCLEKDWGPYSERLQELCTCGEVQSFRAGPSGGAAAFRKAFRQERKTGYGPFQQEQVL